MLGRPDRSASNNQLCLLALDDLAIKAKESILQFRVSATQSIQQGPNSRELIGIYESKPMIFSDFSE